MKSKAVAVLYTLLSIFIVFNEDKQDHNQYTSDACGYYLYLPAAFIYRNVSQFRFFEQANAKYHFIFALNDSLPGMGGKRLDKYSLGVAFFELPFFVAAHTYCCFQKGCVADGFSPAYQVAGMLSNIAWVVLGLFVLRKFLRQFFDDTVVAWVLLCIAVGTNLYAYTSFVTGMSHPYSFFLFACLLALSYKWRAHPADLTTCILLGLVMGLIFIVRPVNIIAWVIPLSLGLTSGAADKWSKRIAGMAFVFLGTAAIICIQLCYWKYITGTFFYYSYLDQGFNFLHPNIINGLLSYRKGWFVYTPMALAALCGCYFIAGRDKHLCYTLVGYYLLAVYVTFSWRQWWYGGGFGCRPMIESYAFLALPLAALTERINSTRNNIRILSFTGFLLLIALNMFQTYQYSMGLIHWNRMTETYYWKVFGRVDFDRKKNEQYLIPEQDQERCNN